MNKSGSCKKEFAWKVNGSLTTIRLVDEEVISLPQRLNQKTNVRTSFPQGNKIFDGKRQLSAQRSSSQPLSLRDDSALSETTTSNINTLAPKTSLYIATNEFSMDSMFSVASYSSPRARSWSEASESDSSLSPIRQNLGQLELQSQSSMDEEKHGQRRKVLRSSNQNSFQCSNRADASLISSSLKESPLIVSSPRNTLDSISELPSPHLYQQSSPNSTVSIHKQNSFQFKWDYMSNEHVLASSIAMPYGNPKSSSAKASQRYSHVLSSTDELDYASMWERDDEYLFSTDVSSCEASLNKSHEDVASQSMECWPSVASRQDDDCDLKAASGGIDSVRTSREAPLSECNDEYAGEDDWSSGNDFLNEDLWSDVGSMNSLNFDFEEDSLSLSRSFIDKEGGDLDDLCFTNESFSCIFARSPEDISCASKSITESLPSDLKRGQKECGERPSYVSTIPSSSCALPLSSCTLSKSDVKRLARAALLGEANDVIDHDSHCGYLNLSNQQTVSSISCPLERHRVNYRYKDTSVLTREDVSEQMKRFFSSNDSAKGLSLSTTDITTQALSTETQAGCKNQQVIPAEKGTTYCGNDRHYDRFDDIKGCTFEGDATDDDDDDNSIFAHLSSSHHH